MESIREILKSIRPECNFDDSEDFFADGLLDSFDLLTLVSELDAFFKVSIDGQDIVPENFKSIDAINCLLQRMGVAR